MKLSIADFPFPMETRSYDLPGTMAETETIVV